MVSLHNEHLFVDQTSLTWTTLKCTGEPIRVTTKRRRPRVHDEPDPAPKATHIQTN
jgi:hypothetical protein